MSLKKVSAIPIICTQNLLAWEECHFCILKIQHIRAVMSPPWEGLSCASGNLGAYWQVRAWGDTRELLSVTVIWNEGSLWKYHPGRFLQRRRKIPVVCNTSWSPWNSLKQLRGSSEGALRSPLASGNIPWCYVTASKWYSTSILQEDLERWSFHPVTPMK